MHAEKDKCHLAGEHNGHSEGEASAVHVEFDHGRDYYRSSIH